MSAWPRPPQIGRFDVENLGSKNPEIYHDFLPFSGENPGSYHVIRTIFEFSMIFRSRLVVFFLDFAALVVTTVAVMELC